MIRAIAICFVKLLSKPNLMRKLFSIKCSDTTLSIATFILRVGAGSLMLVSHGLDKLMNFGEKASRFADPFNIGSTTSLSMVVFAEFFCAVFIQKCVLNIS